MNQAGCNPRVVVEIRQVINMVKIAHLVPGEMEMNGEMMMMIVMMVNIMKTTHQVSNAEFWLKVSKFLRYLKENGLKLRLCITLH